MYSFQLYREFLKNTKKNREPAYGRTGRTICIHLGYLSARSSQVGVKAQATKNKVAHTSAGGSNDRNPMKSRSAFRQHTKL